MGLVLKVKNGSGLAFHLPFGEFCITKRLAYPPLPLAVHSGLLEFRNCLPFSWHISPCSLGGRISFAAPATVLFAADRENLKKQCHLIFIALQLRRDAPCFSNGLHVAIRPHCFCLSATDILTTWFKRRLVRFFCAGLLSISLRFTCFKQPSPFPKFIQADLAAS